MQGSCNSCLALLLGQELHSRCRFVKGVRVRVRARAINRGRLSSPFIDL